LNDSNEEVRTNAEIARTFVYEKYYKNELVERLRNEGKNPTITTIHEIGEWRVEEAVELLIGFLKHDNEYIRISSATALRMIGSQSAKEALEQIETK